MRHAGVGLGQLLQQRQQGGQGLCGLAQGLHLLRQDLQGVRLRVDQQFTQHLGQGQRFAFHGGELGQGALACLQVRRGRQALAVQLGNQRLPGRVVAQRL